MDNHQPSQNPEELPTRAAVLQSIALVHSAMLLIALAILYFQEIEWWNHFNAPFVWQQQGLYGALFGTFTALTCVIVGARWSLLKEVGSVVELLMQVLRPNYGLLLCLSAIAGFVEELLFRAALQPTIGIWGATILFTLAHGLSPVRFPALAIYLSMVFLVGLWLGIAAERLGLLCVMVAHTVHNAVVFAFALREFHSNRSTNTENH